MKEITCPLQGMLEEIKQQIVSGQSQYSIDLQKAKETVERYKFYANPQRVPEERCYIIPVDFNSQGELRYSSDGGDKVTFYNKIRAIKFVRLGEV